VNIRPEKILAIQFKYFGDAVLLTPALRALREHFPNGEIHLVVPEEIAPLFENLPTINRVWAIPRKRGQANLRKTLPIIRALRREKFSRSVDFATNDRGAILSFLVGARERLAWDENTGFLGRKFCYTTRAAPEKKLQHESARLVQLLTGWKIPPPDSLVSQIIADPKFADEAAKILPAKTILCHVGTSRPRKEWPLAHWQQFYRLTKNAGFSIVFSSGNNERERELLAELKKLEPKIFALPPVYDLKLFLAVLARAAVFISGDTGPLHFAAALGVPTIALFGFTLPVQWAPLGPRHQFLTGTPCTCSGHSFVCYNSPYCLAGIAPEKVFAALQKTSEVHETAR
jgi:ADP-heptose:LPS heptosyltransferase